MFLVNIADWSHGMNYDCTCHQPRCGQTLLDADWSHGMNYDCTCHQPRCGQTLLDLLFASWHAVNNKKVTICRQSTNPNDSRSN